MKEQELAIAVRKAMEERAKRPPGEIFRDMINEGIIDEQGVAFSENLQKVQDLLRGKGFNDDISAWHIGGVPSGAVHLHEKVADGRDAEGPYDKIRELIKKARSQEGLWKRLQAAGYGINSLAAGKKKTG